MPPQRRRHCRSRQGKDRAHKYLTASQFIACKACGEPTLPHRACPSCGNYDGRVYATSKKQTAPPDAAAGGATA